PEQRWLAAEEAARRFPNAAIIRLSSVLSRDEGDVIVTQLGRSTGINLAGRDPNVQFISVDDAAKALAAAAFSSHTGIFNATGAGTIPLYKAFRAAGTERIPLPGGARMRPMAFNWTVSGEKAARELGFVPSKSTI